MFRDYANQSAYFFVNKAVCEEKYLWISFLSGNLRPRYGGQLEDRGFLYLENKWLEIQGIRFSSSGVEVAIFAENISSIDKGTLVVVLVDQVYRIGISRIHTSIHLLCSLVDNEMQTARAGFNVGRVDFEGDARDFNNKYDKILSLFNEKIASALPVAEVYMTKSEILDLGDVKEFSKQDQKLYRVIEIKNTDRRICMGTHVTNTLELKGAQIKKASQVTKDSFKINVSF